MQYQSPQRNQSVPLNYYNQSPKQNYHVYNSFQKKQQPHMYNDSSIRSPIKLEKPYNYNYYKDNYDSQYKKNYQASNNNQSRFNQIGKQVINKNDRLETTYQKGYKQPPQVQFKLMNPQLENLYVPDLPRYPDNHYIKFQGKSRYKEDFIDMPTMDEIRLINSQKIQRKKVQNSMHHFYGSSTYNQMFKPFIFEKKIQNPDISLSRRSYQPKFQGTSTYNRDYLGFKIQIPRRYACQLQTLPTAIPKTSTNNYKNHMHYDSLNQKFA